MANREAKIGDVVAFNNMADAVWFDVIEIEGFQMTVREHGTDYRPQVIDKSLVKRIR